MNQLFLYSIFCILFIFTKENIIYQDLTHQCKEIKYETNSLKIEPELLPSDYVINTEYCSRHNAQLNPDKCCHIILDTLDFCGIIKKNEYDDITKTIETLNSTSSKYNEIKIDCFSKHLNFMIITFITCLIYLS